MAQAQTIKFGKVVIMLDNGSGVYTAPCGIDNLQMAINIESNNVNVPDCDDPDLAAWLATDIISKQMVITFSGILDKAAMMTWQAWWLNGGPDGDDERNIRWVRDIGAPQAGYFQAPAVLTAYNENGQRGQRWLNGGTINVNGKPTYTLT